MMGKLLGRLFDKCWHFDPEKTELENTLELPSQRGVILFADKDGVVVQLVTVANIRNYVRSRLFGPVEGEKARRAKLAGIVKSVFYLCCYCQFNTNLQHYKIAKALFPGDYENYVTFTKVWYLKINLGVKWPRFSISDNPEYFDSVKTFGPFFSHKNANNYLNILTDAFGICRQSQCIDNPAKAASCPYRQMHKCLSPCLQKDGDVLYRSMIKDACMAAAGRIESFIGAFEKEISGLAKELAFEEAQEIKNRLEKLRLLGESRYGLVGDIGEKRLLHIDRSLRRKVEGKKKKVQVYSAFLIYAGNIIELPVFTVDKIERMVSGLNKKLIQLEGKIKPQNIRESLSIVACSVFRSNTQGIWIDCEKIVSAEELAGKIEDRFGNPSAERK